MEIRRILIPTDLSDRVIEALKLGAIMSSKLNAEITLLCMIDPGSVSSKSDAQKELAHIIEDEIADQIEIMKGVNSGLRKVKLQTLAQTEPIQDMIIRFCRDHQMDMIIAGRTYFAETYERSIAYKIVSHADCPVISWKSSVHTNQLQNILVPLDLTAATMQKIPLAGYLAKEFDAKITFLSTYTDEIEKTQCDEQHRVATNFLKVKGVRSTSVLLESEDIVTSILEYQQGFNPDLMIIMKRPSYQLKDFFISPRALKLLERSIVPIVTIRPLEEWNAGL